jgi:hypothetical protein
MSAFFKIPLQALILLTGVLMFVFFLFNKGPMLFNHAPLEQVKRGARGPEYQALEQQYDRAFEARRRAAEALATGGDQPSSGSAVREAFVEADAEVRAVRQRASALVRDVTQADYDDVNYVFPGFVTEYMPIGLVTRTTCSCRSWPRRRGACSRAWRRCTPSSSDR